MDDIISYCEIYFNFMEIRRCSVICRIIAAIQNFTEILAIIYFIFMTRKPNLRVQEIKNKHCKKYYSNGLVHVFEIFHGLNIADNSQLSNLVRMYHLKIFFVNATCTFRTLHWYLCHRKIFLLQFCNNRSIFKRSTPLISL